MAKQSGSRVTRKMRQEEHRIKMEMKAAKNAMNQGREVFTFANISVNHEHFGDTPIEHTKRKLGTLEKSS
jgi:hypothetical protein